MNTLIAHIRNDQTGQYEVINYGQIEIITIDKTIMGESVYCVNSLAWDARASPFWLPAGSRIGPYLPPERVITPEISFLRPGIDGREITQRQEFSTINRVEEILFMGFPYDLTQFLSGRGGMSIDPQRAITVSEAANKLYLQNTYPEMSPWKAQLRALEGTAFVVTPIEGNTYES
ncbi:MAG: hypothetical protein HQL99_13360 [Magnetococcales bacterium]|nr:hypothetical protein [Magnetococcales bacterium]